MKLVRVAVAGAVMGFLCGLLAQSYLVAWEIKVSLLVLLSLTLPTSRHLSGRILVVVMSFLGTSLLWWLIPVGQFGVSHGVLLAAVVGALAGGNAMLAWGRGLRATLVPKLAWVDAIPVAAAAVTIAYVRRPLFLANSTDAVALTLWRWDSSSHVYLANLLHDTGRLQVALGQAFDQTSWGFQGYPTGYHSAVASLIDLMVQARADRVSELLGFWHAVALLLVVVVTGSVAALTRTPVARTRPLVTAVVGAAMVFMFLFGPGLQPVADAHQNVPIAFLSVAAVFSAALSSDRVWHPREVGLAAAGVVTATGAWAPIGALVGLGTLALLLPAVRSRWSASRRDVVTSIALAVVGVATVIGTLRWASSVVSGDFLLVANGGVTPVDGTILLVTGCLVLVAWVVSAARAVTERSAAGAVVRLAALGITPVGALGMYLYSAHVQIITLGDVRYYATKLGVAACVIGLLYVCFAAVHLAPVLDPAQAPSRPVRFLTAIALAVACAFPYGSVVPKPYFVDSEAPGRATYRALTAQDEGELVEKMLRVAMTLGPTEHVAVLDPQFGALNCGRYTVAIAAIRGTYTDGGSDVINRGILDIGPQGDVLQGAGKLLRGTKGVTVITDSASRTELVRQLGASVEGRILSYT